MHRVTLVDRNPSLAEALAVQLSLPNAVVCTGLAAPQAVGAVQLKQVPDLMILDPAQLALQPGFDLGEYVDGLRARNAALRLLCYSFDSSDPMVTAIMHAGFHGGLSKTATLDQLEVAIAAVLGGGVYFDDAFAARALQRCGQNRADLLSAREKEVLVRIAKGLAGKQIAFDLSISAKTVETYKARAIQKLGLTDRSKVVEYALEHGWIS
ncbi:response regulator transcription factor [Cognatishimia sp. SS12]|uniref:response regulator transcription factor n=1 Tax=Cognatishimia sp. SS12 TaxID=2979465 RepID=UPI00232BD189|nr:response regulator transcription factor [Cognatishimia sp. SS12]MDC0738698.1 response regulator transcription factor [Cognatishimia sp. SS12]